ncbi:MAG: response regulator [Verrucomicrobia bacterium]|nr:response regulator [Verrucomicrobiota bacterium]
MDINRPELSVLVVDDEAEIRELIAQFLSLIGASATLADNARAAIKEVQGVRPDIILLDLIMPGQDGFDFLNELYQLGTNGGGDTPVVVVTGQRDPDVEAQIRAAGFGYLSKPFTPLALYESIAEALDQPVPINRRLPTLPMLARPVSWS